VVLADEPTGNLDSENSEGILELLMSLNRSLGVSLVVVTHDMDLAAKLGRTVVISDGRIDGSP
jgi:ABC-type lipoprotein export system ATPase subunit